MAFRSTAELSLLCLAGVTIHIFSVTDLTKMFHMAELCQQSGSHEICSALIIAEKLERKFSNVWVVELQCLNRRVVPWRPHFASSDGG